MSSVEIKVSHVAAEIKVYDNSQLRMNGYENNRWSYLMVLPLMWLLAIYVMIKKIIYRLVSKSEPEINTVWFDGFGPLNRKIKEGSTSWKALDVIYNYYQGKGSRFDDFWIGMMNAQAVRNRYKLVKKLIRYNLRRFNSSEIRILSLACGSAQPVIEVIAELKIEGVTIRALLVDIDQSALNHARKLASLHGVESQIEFLETSVAKVSRIAKDFQPHIIEMVGLLDYIPKDKAVRLVKLIFEVLPPKGVFLTANIFHNPEKYFLRWVIDWPMIHRTPAQLMNIIKEAGFNDSWLIIEPLNIHGLVEARKNDIS